MIQLTQREHKLAWIGTAILVVGLFYGFIIKPALDRTERLYELVPQKQKALAQIQRLGQRYTQLNLHMNNMRSAFTDPAGGGALLAHLDTLLKRHGLGTNATLDPELPVQEGPYTVNVIQVQLEGIHLPALLAFLQELRTGSLPLHVETMGLNRPKGAKDHLNAQLTLYSPSRTPNAA